MKPRKAYRHELLSICHILRLIYCASYTPCLAVYHTLFTVGKSIILAVQFPTNRGIASSRSHETHIFLGLNIPFNFPTGVGISSNLYAHNSRFKNITELLGPLFGGSRNDLCLVSSILRLGAHRSVKVLRLSQKLSAGKFRQGRTIVN